MKSIQHIVVIDQEKKAIDKTIERIEDFNILARFYKASTAIGLEKILDKEDVDLIILELELDAYKGYQTYKVMAELAESVPILVYTHTQNEIIISQILRAGALDCLVKIETKAKQLARAVRNAPLRHQLIVELASAKTDMETAKKRSVEAQKIAKFGDWTIDIVTGEMTWSDTMYDIFNLPIGKEIESRTQFVSMVYSEDQETVDHFFNEVIKHGQLEEATFRIKDAKIGFQYLKVRAKVQMFDAIGGMVIVGTCQDVTKEVQSQTAMIAQHFSTKTNKIQREMLSHLGFNIRTKMGSLVSLFYLFEETVVNEEQKSLLRGMRASFDGLNEDLHQFLNSTVALNKELKVNPQQIRARSFFEGFSHFVKAKEANDLKLDFSTAEKIPDYLLFDGDKLQQILLNIIHAFADTASANEKQIAIQVTSRHDKGNRYSMKINVAFDGYFPYAQEEEIFEQPISFLAKVATNNKAYESADSDLAIAARLVKIMDGALTFLATPKVTKLSFTIPVTHIEEGKKSSAKVPLYALKILLVEDHIINQIATRKVLEKWGEVTIEVAKNGKEAVDMVSSKAYDIVLMDLQMPILGGVEATKIIRKSHTVPIVALTAHASDDERENCLNIGMDDYLTKPFKPKELYEIINQTLRRLAEKGA